MNAEPPILLDTDILVDFLRGNERATRLVESESSRILLSAISAAELYAGVKGEREETALEEFVSLFRVVPVTVEIGKLGGFYRRDYGKSHGTGLADAIIVATAESEGASLKTLNTRHYPMLKGLRPAYRK